MNSFAQAVGYGIGVIVGFTGGVALIGGIACAIALCIGKTREFAEFIKTHL